MTPEWWQSLLGDAYAQDTTVAIWCTESLLDRLAGLDPDSWLQQLEACHRHVVSSVRNTIPLRSNIDSVLGTTVGAHQLNMSYKCIRASQCLDETLAILAINL